MSKQQRGFLLRLAVSVIGLALVVLTVDVRQAVASLLTIAPSGLLLAIAIFQLGLVVRALRWWLLLRAHAANLPLWQLLRLYYIGMFFNLFLPTGFGGDVVRAAELGSSGVSRPTAAATVLLDRMLGIVALFAVAIVAAPFAIGLVPANLLWTGVTLSVVGCFAGALVLQGRLFAVVLTWAERLLGRFPLVLKLITSLRKFNDAVALVGREPRTLGAAFGVSLVFNLLLILMHIVLSQALSLQIPPLAYAIIVPLTSILLLVPSIAGIGLREVSLVGMLALFDANLEASAALGFAVLLQNIISGVVGLLWYLQYSLVKRGQSTSDSVTPQPD